MPTRLTGMRALAPLVRTCVLVLAATLCTMTDAVANCVPAIRLTASGLRSADNRGVLFNVYDGTLVSAKPAGAVAEMNTALTSSSGQLRVEDFTLLPSETPPRVLVTFEQRTSYEIFANDTYSLTLSGSMFVGGVPCPAMALVVHPSAGRVTSNAPAGLSEIDINSGDTSFVVSVAFDYFLRSELPLRETPRDGIALSYDFSDADGNPVAGTKSRHVRITIARNESLNLGTSETVRLAFWFPKEGMETGLVPSTGDFAFENDITVTIDGALPFVTVDHGNSDNLLYAEDVWDGRGRVTLRILGDVWIQDNALWNTSGTMPTLAPSRPVQQFGFQYFLNRGILPTVNVSGRDAVFIFPEMRGFTLSNVPVTGLEVSGFGALATEGTSIQPVSIRVLRAKLESVSLTWGGPAFGRVNGLPAPPLSEPQVRQAGVNFTVEIRYDIFADPPNVVLLTETLFTATGQLRISELAASVSDLNVLTLTLPPQPDYDIAANDIINVTLPGATTESNQQPLRPSAGFVISTFAGASTCDLRVTNGTLDETTIRSTTGPPIRLQLSIASGFDTFCATPTALGDLEATEAVAPDSIQGAVTLRRIAVFATRIIYEVQRDTGYEISRDNFLSLTVPKTLMCSREICRAVRNLGSDFDPSYLQLPIATTSGIVSGTLPTITEAQMRTESYTIYLSLVGDTFLLDGGATSSSAQPVFDVTSSSENERGFMASIRGQTRLTWNSSAPDIAQLVIPANASFDVGTSETVRIIVSSTITSSRIQPRNLIVPMQIAVVQGAMLGSIEKNVTIRESVILRGGFEFTVRLENEVFTSAALIARDLRTTSFRPGVTTNSVGLKELIGTYLADSAVTLNADRTAVTIRFEPAGEFDLLNSEEIRLSFGPTSVVSGIAPMNNSFAIVVQPDPGRLTVNGSAVEAGTLEVVAGGLQYDLWLENDLWVANLNDIYDRDLFCVLAPQCAVVPARNRRQVTVFFNRYDDFFITVNSTYAITLPPNYFLSNSTPEGRPTLKVFVTSGQVDWAWESEVTEDRVRDGLLSNLIATVNGDKFSVPSDVRNALIAGVSCDSGENVTNLYGFCARAATLFQGLEFSLSSGNRRMSLKLQGDSLYDIFQQETVTLYLGAGAFQSRLAPNRSFVTRLVVFPRPGRFFLSGTLTGLTEADVKDPLRAAQVKISLTLHGERWLPNASNSLRALVDGGAFSSSSRSSLIRGFLAFTSQIFNPAASGTLDVTRRVLTLQFMPVTTFSLFEAETISVTIPSAAVMSTFAPTLQSTASGFTLNKQLGVLTSLPTTIYAADVRRGVNVTVLISGATWRSLSLAVARIPTYITTKSSPLVEPRGFAVYREQLLGTVENGITGAESNQFKIPLVPVSDYQLTRPEIVYLAIGGDWVVENVATDPSRLQIRFDPDYPTVEAVVKVETVNDQVDVARWTEAVASALGVTPLDVILEPSTGQQETYLPQPNVYRRMTFRVRYDPERDPDADPEVQPLFDNTAAQFFVGIDSDFTMSSFNVTTAFFNSTPPPDGYWRALAAGEAFDDSGPAIGADTIYLLSFGGAIIAVLLAVYIYIRATKGRNKTSLRWSASKGQEALLQHPGAAGNQGGEDEDVVLKRAAEIVYAGQRCEVPVLRETNAQVHEVGHSDPGRAAVGAKTAYRTSVQTRLNDDEDGDGQFEELALPMNLYAGQAAARAQRQQAYGAGVPILEPPSLVERFDPRMRPSPPGVPQRPGAAGSPLAGDDEGPSASLEPVFEDEVELWEAKRAREQAEAARGRISFYHADVNYRPAHRSKFAVRGAPT